MTVEVRHKTSKSILSKASGFAGGFDYTLNPYSGCVFACSYCYAAFFTPTVALKESWGQWVEIKANALELLRKKRKRPLDNASIYMSSVTDPYQPIERQLELTRSLLEELLNYHRVRLVVQTRSPLVTRDIDLLRQFPAARVNMTVTTDDDEIRRVFEPFCPSTAQRLDAVQQLSAAGINACITMTPLLPVRDATQFARRLRETGAQRFVIQDFHPANRRFVASTGEKALALLREREWDSVRYEGVRAVMAAELPGLLEGRDGFLPE